MLEKTKRQLAKPAGGSILRQIQERDFAQQFGGGGGVAARDVFAIHVTAAGTAASGMARPVTVMTFGASPSGETGPGVGTCARADAASAQPAMNASARLVHGATRGHGLRARGAVSPFEPAKARSKNHGTNL
jgi:hypothetical protein